MSWSDYIQRAEHVLASCIGPEGMRASAQEGTNYGAYFTRDTILNLLGLSLTGDDSYLTVLAKQLYHLRDIQGPGGQIASNFKIREGEYTHVSFGTLTPKLDGLAWYVIAVCYCISKELLRLEDFEVSIQASIEAMDLLEYNGHHVIHAPMGADWADEYICHGEVLHLQVIRAWALKEASRTLKNERLSKKSAAIKEVIITRFGNFHETEQGGYLIAYRTPSSRPLIFDMASNVLFMLAFPKEDVSNKISTYINIQFTQQEILVPAFFPVIDQQHTLWSALRDFHLYEFKNRPGHYHNGGAWWIWAGWYALVLKKRGEKERLESLLKNYAGSLPVDSAHFQFAEYIDQEGYEGGQTQMGFTAAGMMMIDNVIDRAE